MFNLDKQYRAYLFMAVFFLMLTGTALAQNNRSEKYYRGKPLNPTIQAMVDMVSTDSLLTNLERLVGFHTRHTSSDTTSPDTGIGAARNFILNKFQQYADESNQGLQASFFVFPATVCGIFNAAHKNVLATIPGTKTPDRIYIASGHMDGRTVGVCDNTSFAPSANDDGSGTVVSMELARIFSQFTNNLESTIILMTVTGEDEGLFGSTAYAEWAAANSLRIDGMITNDVVGNIEGCEDPACPGGNFIIDSTSVRHFSGNPSTSSSRQFARYMKLTAEQYVTDVPWSVNLIPAIDRPGRSGDHVPFFERGYAAVRFTEPHENGDGSGLNGHQHNPTDLIEFMNMAYLARVVKTNLAGLASLAMAPATPPFPISVHDVGNGNDLFLSWNVANSEPDFDGYRIAWRHVDSLFYQEIIPVGNATQYTITGLTPDQSIYVCYSALDTAGNESIFSQEVLATPREIPAIPQGFTATSSPTGIQLTWEPNNELDLAGYTVSRVAPDSTIQTFLVDSSTTNFSDNTAQPHTLYHYDVRARDNDGNVSLPSPALRGQLATHDLGILVVDASRDGPGGNPLFPSDEEVDNYYQDILAHFSISGQWDIEDSLQQQLAITDADMAVYSTVILHSDVRLPTHQIANDTVAFKKYLQNGGQILASGWQLLTSVSGSNISPKVFTPGEFVYDFMEIDSAEIAATNDFKGADAIAGGYPSITVDSLKIPNFGGDLIGMEVLHSFTPGSQAEAIYTYRSSQQPPSQFHGAPTALRQISIDPKIVIIDFPLYYMQKDVATQLIIKALLDLGEVTGIGDDPGESGLHPQKFALSQNYPNPFNPTTTLQYQLPNAVPVRLSIYNILGQKVITLVNKKQPAGVYNVEWDGKDRFGKLAASGIYIYRLEAEEFVSEKKLVLIR